MKRLLVMLLMLALMAMPAAAETELEKYCDQLNRDVAELAGNTQHLMLSTGGWWLDEELLSLSGKPGERPLADVYLTYDAQAVASRMVQEGVLTTEQTEEYLRLFMPGLLTTQLLSDDYSLVTANALSAAAYYVDPAQPDGAMVFVRFYEEGMPIIFRLLAHDGAVQLTAVPWLDWENCVTGGSAEEVQVYLDQKGLTGFIAAAEPVLLPYFAVGLTGDTMAQMAASLVRHMMDCVEQEELRAILGLQEAQVQIMDGWVSADYTAPRLMAGAPLSLEEHGFVLNGAPVLPLMMEGDTAAVRKLRLTLAEQAINNTIFSYSAAWNPHMNIDKTLVCASTAMGTMYPDPDQPDGSGLFVLLYEGGHQVMVGWTASSGVVLLEACYLPADMSDVDDVAGITLRLIGMGLALQFEEVVLE